MKGQAQSRVIGATFTTLLHLAAGLGLLHVTRAAVEPVNAHANEPIFAERLNDAGELLVSVNIGELVSTPPLPCLGGSYLGIGIVADPRTQRIIMVGENTPASRAGLRHDDIVLNPEIWEQAQHEGALLAALVLRDSEKLLLKIQVGRVCIG